MQEHTENEVGVATVNGNAKVHNASATPVRSLNEIQERRDLILKAMGTVLKDGVHYGKIPGCGDKPSLFLAGAEALASMFGLFPRYKFEVTKDGVHREYEVTCELYSTTGAFAGSGISTCSTYESKYRYRRAERTCPKCGAAAIVAGRPEYGGGYICYQKRGGCGAKFQNGDKSIESQPVGYVENPDIPDTWNTVKKMAAKRAFVHAIRTATATADVFTQDIEDFRDTYSYPLVETIDVVPTSVGHDGEPQPSDQGATTNTNGFEVDGDVLALVEETKALFEQFERPDEELDEYLRRKYEKVMANRKDGIKGWRQELDKLKARHISSLNETMKSNWKLIDSALIAKGISDEVSRSTHKARMLAEWIGAAKRSGMTFKDKAENLNYIIQAQNEWLEHNSTGDYNGDGATA